MSNHIDQLHNYLDASTNYELFKPGDYVKLRTDVNHQLKYTDIFHNKCGYVIACVKHETPSAALYGYDNMKLAIVEKGKINSYTCDSRAFVNVPSSFKINPLLKEFANDEPIKERKIGMLVRARKNYQVQSNFLDWRVIIPFSGKSYVPLLEPMLIIKIKAGTRIVTVAGLISKSSEVEEVEVDSEFLCEYIEETISNETSEKINAKLLTKRNK